MSRQCSLLVFAVAGLGAGASADVITSTFEADAEGWIVADGNSPENESVSTPAMFQASGGNADGFITTAINWPGTAFFVAPDLFLGDQSDKFAGSVTVDRRFVQPDSAADTNQVDYSVDLTMTGLGGAVTLAADLPMVSLVSWESFSVDLSSVGGWFHLNSGVAATDAEILSVLGDLEDIRLRGNIRDTFGRIGTDNFSLVPTPGAVALLAMTGLSALRRRR